MVLKKWLEIRISLNLSFESELLSYQNPPEPTSLTEEPIFSTLLAKCWSSSSRFTDVPFSSNRRSVFVISTLVVCILDLQI